jgi:hypothetical protein
MKKSTLLSSALAIVLTSSLAMAADGFQALSVIQAAPMQDAALASTEGGSICQATAAATSAVNGGAPGGGVSLCSSVGPGGDGAAFGVSNQLPVTAANYLQVIGWLPAGTTAP